MTNESTPGDEKPTRGCYRGRHDQMVKSYRSSPIGQLQLHADDFNPGSHLEVGDLIAMDVSLGATRRHLGDLPTRDRESGRASVGRDKAGDLNLRIDGMSEYPAPTYPEPDGR